MVSSINNKGDTAQALLDKLEARFKYVMRDIFQYLWSDSSPQLDDVKDIRLSYQFLNGFTIECNLWLNKKTIVDLTHQ
jgi:hypothetical protein